MFDLCDFNPVAVNGTIYLEWFDLEERYSECCPLATIEQIKRDKEYGFLTPPDTENRLEAVKSKLEARFLDKGKTYDKEELKEALELFAEKYC